MDKGNVYTCKCNESSSKELDELNFDCLKYNMRTGVCFFQVSTEYKIIYGNS